MPGPLSAADRELVFQLLDDVAIIGDAVTTIVPKPAAVRTVLVPILRRWIAEGLFFRAQKLILPYQVRFETYCDGESIECCKAMKLVHWMEVMAFGSVGVGIAQVAPEHIGPDGKPTFNRSKQDRAERIPHKPSDFFDQNILFWDGDFYSRADIIKLHANTLGGVHFDFKNPKTDMDWQTIKNYHGYEITGQNNVQILVSAEIQPAKDDPKRRQYVYDATEIVAIDTATTFVKGIRDAEDKFSALLTP